MSENDGINCVGEKCVFERYYKCNDIRLYLCVSGNLEYNIGDNMRVAHCRDQIRYICGLGFQQLWLLLSPSTSCY